MFITHINKILNNALVIISFNFNTCKLYFAKFSYSLFTIFSHLPFLRFMTIVYRILQIPYGLLYSPGTPEDVLRFVEAVKLLKIV